MIAYLTIYLSLALISSASIEYDVKCPYMPGHRKYYLDVISSEIYGELSSSHINSRIFLQTCLYQYHQGIKHIVFTN